MSVLFLAYFMTLSVVLPRLFVPTGRPIWAIVFWELLTVGLAIDLAESTCLLFSHTPKIPPQLRSLEKRPTVALLMLTCDDVVLEPLLRLRDQTYENVSLFVLDDSSQQSSKDEIDRSGYKVVRRDGRRGFKAGSVNSWLRTFGNDYDYFVLLDSDSILPADCVERLLWYGEHPSNQDVAIFNTLPHCWNTGRRFPRLLSSVLPIQNWIRLRIDNLSVTTFSTGHNNLHRTQAVLEVGGFNEDFVAEDIVLSLTLLQHGFRSVLTDVVASDAEPEHIFSFVRRQQRWAAQTIQAANGSWGTLPLCVRFQLFKLVWMYLGVFLYPVWALAAAWGTTSRFADLASIGGAFITKGGVGAGSMMRIVVPLVLPLLMFLLKTPIAFAAGVRLRDFLVHLVFSWNVAFYSMFGVVSAAAHALIQRDLRFEVTDKRLRGVTIREVLLRQPMLAPFLVLVAMGLCQNIVGLVLALPWFTMLFLCQLVMYCSHDGYRQPRSGAI
jgi:hypothetical protein